MNPLIARVLGGLDADPTPSERTPPATTVREDVPVPLGMPPRQTFRDRLRQRRRQAARTSDIRRVVGEAQSVDDAGRGEDSLIPKDAETLDDAGATVQKGVRSVKNVVLEPRDPYGEKEQLMTPASALVAPDCTPEAMRPLPPSGAGNPAGRFRTRDADADTGGGDPPTALDVVLDRAQPPPQQQLDAPTSMESAYRLLNVPSPATQAVADRAAASGGALGQQILAEGQAMPEHVASDGRNVCNAFRRFMP